MVEYFVKGSLQYAIAFATFWQYAKIIWHAANITHPDPSWS